MEKKCFIIMPVSEPDGYAKGHFSRVYQYIMVPACRLAGFNPLRVGAPDIDDTPLGIIKTIIESDIMLCDISLNDTPALYGFTIRQSMNLPVTLMKDLKTTPTANIPEFDMVEYDESLRIDTVQNEIETLSEALKKSFANQTEDNPLLSRLNMKSVQNVEEPFMPTYTEASSSTSPTEEDPKEKEPSLQVISPLPDFVGDPLTQHEIDHLREGDFIFHMNYGKGEIMMINHKTKDILARITFDSGTKVLVLVPAEIFRKIKT